jgi:hypothetical protein
MLAGGAFFPIRQGIGLRCIPVWSTKPEIFDYLPGILSALRERSGYPFFVCWQLQSLLRT